jgi:hypothetical protein
MCFTRGGEQRAMPACEKPPAWLVDVFCAAADKFRISIKSPYENDMIGNIQRTVLIICGWEVLRWLLKVSKRCFGFRE